MIPRPEIASRRERILIVDDELQNRRLLEVMLEAEGFDLLTAASGEEALTMVAQQPPDLILLDVMMAGLDGYHVAVTLKRDLATKNIPVIMVSALHDRDARMRGLNAGAEDFLTKPVDRAELCVRVRNLLRLKAYGDYYDKYSRALEEAHEENRKANDDLAASHVLLERYATDLEAKVEARTTIVHTQAAEIEALYLRSEEATRLRSEIIANLSHELRTPLTTIIGYHDLLEDELRSDGRDDARHTLGRVRGQVERLRSVLESLIVLAELRRGVVGVNRSRFTCAVVLADLRADALRLNIDRGLEFEWLSTSADVEVENDREKVRIIGYHLLSNAIKFTHVGRVVVTVSSADGWLTLTVADTGVGVPFKARQLIFDDFQQLDGSSTRRFEGLGLGLGIVTRSVALLDGKLALESTPGVGTTMRVDLPPPGAPTRAAAPPDDSTVDAVMERFVPGAGSR